MDPQVPEDGEVAPGWAAIDSLGAWDTFLCKFAVLQEVPEQHKGAWADAWVQVLRRWEGAESEEERDRALRWLAFLPQALLRKPGRGGRQGRREVAKRFLCVTEGDWGNLVVMWGKDHLDIVRLKERRQQRGMLKMIDRKKVDMEKGRQEKGCLFPHWKKVAFFHTGK